MNKKTVSKLELFFSGLLSRMQENKDFFKSIKIIYKSGTKSFVALIAYENELTLNYQAVKRSVTVEQLCDFIKNESSIYDEARVEYCERGANIVIEATDKRVAMKHEDVTDTVEKASVVQTDREYMVNPALAKDLLSEIGILAKNGKIKNDKIRKYNQIDYFVELLQGVINELGDVAKNCKKSRIFKYGVYTG